MTCKKVLTFIVFVVASIAAGLYYLAHVDLLGGRKFLRNATRAFENIEIRTSKLGVKFIEAETFNGGLYGIGVAHARDRLWQLYFFRLLSQGRVSEVIYPINILIALRK
jgi:penicillin amidase